MIFRFGTWNVNYRIYKPEHYAFIKKVDVDVLALQEVSAQFQDQLKDTGLFDWAFTSFSICPQAAGASRSRRIGCSVFGKTPIIPEEVHVLKDVAFPERSLIVKAQTPIGKASFCSFHVPPGASWKKIKPQTMCAIAACLGKLPGEVIVGIDANAPKLDHPDHNQNVWWWKDEPRLLGVSPDHHLRDALRVYLEEHPEKFQEIKQARPSGPLQLSHVRRCGPVRIDCRYDFILLSPGVRVGSIEYLYDESLKAGSDHAMVVAELEIT